MCFLINLFFVFVACLLYLTLFLTKLCCSHLSSMAERKLGATEKFLRHYSITIFRSCFTVKWFKGIQNHENHFKTHNKEFTIE